MLNQAPVLIISSPLPQPLSTTCYEEYAIIVTTVTRIKQSAKI